MGPLSKGLAQLARNVPVDLGLREQMREARRHVLGRTGDSVVKEQIMPSDLRASGPWEFSGHRAARRGQNTDAPPFGRLGRTPMKRNAPSP